MTWDAVSSLDEALVYAEEKLTELTDVHEGSSPGFSGSCMDKKDPASRQETRSYLPQYFLKHPSEKPNKIENHIKILTSSALAPHLGRSSGLRR